MKTRWCDYALYGRSTSNQVGIMQRTFFFFIIFFSRRNVKSQRKCCTWINRLIWTNQFATYWAFKEYKERLLYKFRIINFAGISRGTIISLKLAGSLVCATELNHCVPFTCSLLICSQLAIYLFSPLSLWWFPIFQFHFFPPSNSVINNQRVA